LVDTGVDDLAVALFFLHSEMASPMATVGARILLFLSSYVPLCAIFAVLLWEEHFFYALAAIGIGVASLVGLTLYLRSVQRLGAKPVTVEEVSRQDSEAMSYIVTYLLPFLGLAFSNWRQGVALAIFFLMLGFLYVNSNMIHINPMLNAFRYHLYEVTLSDGSVRTLIARRRRVNRGSTIRVIQVGDDLIIEKK
jgi:hypothetical protein